MSDNVDDKLLRYIGHHVNVGDDDYGRIMELITVRKNDQEYKVFVFSSGKRVEAHSIVRFITTTVHFPDGTDYVMRNRVKYAKAKNKGGAPAFGSSIRNVARFSTKKGK